jgi:hypothetical protein
MSQVHVRFHPHAKERMAERGAIEEEVVLTVQEGERFSVKLGRAGFRRNFQFDDIWNNRRYQTKQIEVIAVEEDDGWLVITVITRFF